VSIGLFVDGGYSRSQCRDVDMEQLVRYVEMELKDKLSEAVYVDGAPPSQASGTARFHQGLTWPRCRGGPGFKLKLYPVEDHVVRYPKGGPVLYPDGSPVVEHKQVGVDIGLALAMLRGHERNGWDKLALMACDGDFLQVLDELKAAGVSICLLSGGDTLAKILVRTGARVIDLLADPARLYVSMSRGGFKHVGKNRTKNG
jgi:uncharacterized LabA/DUF88 family protein